MHSSSKQCKKPPRKKAGKKAQKEARGGPPKEVPLRGGLRTRKSDIHARSHAEGLGKRRHGGGAPKEVRLKKKSKVFSKRSNARLVCVGGVGRGWQQGHGHGVAIWHYTI